MSGRASDALGQDEGKARDHDGQDAGGHRLRRCEPGHGGKNAVGGDVDDIEAPRDMGSVVDLDRALATLKEDERAAVVLCYASGLSHSEAAEMLNMPLGTVKSHVNRGREKLKAWFEKSEALVS